MRHLDTNMLWVQDKVKQDRLKIVKIFGEKSPVDLFTKHHESSKMMEHVGAIGCAIRAGFRNA